MSYALVDYTKNKWSNNIKISHLIGETDILLPPFDLKKSKKFGKKVSKILNKQKIGTVLLNNNLTENIDFCKELLDNKKYIITGKRMYKVLMLRMLKDISVQMDIPLPKFKVVMLINEYSWDNIDLVKIISKEVKSLTIVTNDKEKYSNLVTELFEKFGIVLKVFDKSKINFRYNHVIINVDFNSEDMNKICVNNNSLIFCGMAQNYKFKKGFNGIIIRKIDVISGIVENSQIDSLSFCEARIYNSLRKLRENDRVFEREGYRINSYIGENGRIMAKEFQNLGKIILDK